MFPVLLNRRVEVDGKDQVDIALRLIFDKARSFRIHEIEIHFLVIDDSERIDEEFSG